METIFGFILLVGAIYATYETFATWKNWVTGFSHKTIAQYYSEIQEKGKNTKPSLLKGCWAILVVLPFTLFKEYGYLFIFLPILAIYGIMNVNQLYGLLALVLALTTGIISLALSVRIFKVSLKYGMQLEKSKAALANSNISLPDGQKIILVEENGEMSGNEKIMPGGRLTSFALSVAHTLCNLYVVYLFNEVVLKAQ